MDKKLEEMNEVEIKSLLYDRIMLFEQIKNDINMLQQELARKQNIAK